MAGDERPATIEEVIRGIAKREGVSPALALAVAQKESSLNPSAVGDSGLAMGTFQLHAGAAQDAGVNRNDPIGNITGGIKYLKQLSDRYQGDVEKTLMAYNGGLKHVDDGTVSEDAKAYAAEVLGRLSQNTAPSPAPAQRVLPRAPVAGRGTSTQNVGVQAKSNFDTFTKAWDPRTQEGRQNIAGTVGSVGVGGALSLVQPEIGVPISLGMRVLNVLGPIVGAAIAGGTESAAEQAVTKGTVNPTEAAKVGATQGLYDLGGQVLFWPLKRMLRPFIAPSVARDASTGLHEEAQAAATAARDATEAVRQQVHDVVEATRLSRQHTVDQAVAASRSIRREGARDVARAQTTGKQGVTAARVAGAETVDAAKKQAAERLAQTELDTTAQLAEIGKQYQTMLAPSTLETSAAVKQTLDGPAKRALDLAGERVGAAAEKGNPIGMTPIKDVLNEMAGEARPASIYGGTGEAASAIGYTAPGQVVEIGARPAAMAPANKLTSIEEFKRLMAQKLGVDETHPLPGILGKIQEAPDEISFADAHALKRLLDEAVTWDRVAKKHLERITKGLRLSLRQQMATAGNAEYEAATAAYQALVPLYRKGIGKAILQAASENPDKIVRLLKETEPANALALKSLLVDQAAAGGDAAAGMRAWDAVRSSWTHENVISGGVEKLAQRVRGLITDRPDFVKAVYGDASGGPILHNLATLGETYEKAELAGAERLARQKAQGAAAVEVASDDVERAIQAAGRERDAMVDAARTAHNTSNEVAEEGIAAAKGARDTAVREAKHEGAGAVRASIQEGRAARAEVANKAKRFAGSSLMSFRGKTLEDQAADVVRFGALGYQSYWGAQSALRLILRSPRGSDLVEWAAYSPTRTKLLVRGLTSPMPPLAASAFVRSLVGAYSATLPENQPAQAAR